MVTACASANHSIGEAFRLIKHGFADAVVSGGSEAAITILGLGGFCSAKALSTFDGDPKEACRPFDKTRDGFILAEGAGMLMLEELEGAKARGANILAVLDGYGASGDAYHMTAPAEDGAGGAAAMREALAEAQWNVDEVDYINAHGTSTPVVTWWRPWSSKAFSRTSQVGFHFQHQVLHRTHLGCRRWNRGGPLHQGLARESWFPPPSTTTSPMSSATWTTRPTP